MAGVSNPLIPSADDSFELSQSEKNYREIKSLMPKEAKFDEKQLRDFAKYEGDDLEFIKGVMPYADDEGEFEFDKMDKKTAEKLSMLMVECPYLRDIQEDLFDD